MKYEK
jgi:hypothetical protein